VGAIAFGGIAAVYYSSLPPGGDFGEIAQVFHGIGWMGLVGAIAVAVGGGLAGVVIGRRIDRHDRRSLGPPPG
jgi:hypothetical protein